MLFSVSACLEKYSGCHATNFLDARMVLFYFKGTKATYIAVKITRLKYRYTVLVVYVNETQSGKTDVTVMNGYTYN